MALMRTRIRDEFCNPGILREGTYHKTGHFSVISNLKPLAKGHSLIVTNEHKRGLLDLKRVEARELFETITKILPILLDVYNDGRQAYDIKIRSGDFSGRTVDHFHVHLIPRRPEPGAEGEHGYERIYEKSIQNPDRAPADDRAQVVARLKEEISSNGYMRRRVHEHRDALDEHNLPASLLGTLFCESKHFVVVYSKNPILPGHSLILPKRDTDSLLNLTKEELEDLTGIYAKVMGMLLGLYGDKTKSYITAMQVGGYRGMPTDRLHIHVIPRARGDAYVGRDDEIFYDLFEKGRPHANGHDAEVREAVDTLRRL